MADFGFRTLVADLRFWTTVADFFWHIFFFSNICCLYLKYLFQYLESFELVMD